MTYNADEKAVKVKSLYSKEEWESLLNSINVRKIEDERTKKWFQKMKRYYKEYGMDMEIYQGQLEGIKELSENARSNKV